MEWLWDLLVNLHWGAVGQIIMIDILLGGDNAVVIALACRNLPHEQRLKGVFWGTFGAIALRVILITFAVMLLDLPFLKMVGAALLVWIGVKLLVPEDEHESEKIEGSAKLLGAIKTIIVADFVMSLDNVLRERRSRPTMTTRRCWLFSAFWFLCPLLCSAARWCSSFWIVSP